MDTRLSRSLLVDGAFGRRVRIDPPVPDDIVGEMRLDDVIDEVAVLRHRDGVFIRPYLIMGSPTSASSEEDSTPGSKSSCRPWLDLPAVPGRRGDRDRLPSPPMIAPWGAPSSSSGGMTTVRRSPITSTADSGLSSAATRRRWPILMATPQLCMPRLGRFLEGADPRRQHGWPHVFSSYPIPSGHF